MQAYPARHLFTSSLLSSSGLLEELECLTEPVARSVRVHPARRVRKSGPGPREYIFVLGCPRRDVVDPSWLGTGCITGFQSRAGATLHDPQKHVPLIIRKEGHIAPVSLGDTEEALKACLKL